MGYELAILPLYIYHNIIELKGLELLPKYISITGSSALSVLLSVQSLIEEGKD